MRALSPADLRRVLCTHVSGRGPRPGKASACASAQPPRASIKLARSTASNLRDASVWHTAQGARKGESGGEFVMDFCGGSEDACGAGTGVAGTGAAGACFAGGCRSGKVWLR